MTSRPISFYTFIVKGFICINFNPRPMSHKSCSPHAHPTARRLEKRSLPKLQEHSQDLVATKAFLLTRRIPCCTVLGCWLVLLCRPILYRLWILRPRSFYFFQYTGLQASSNNTLIANLHINQLFPNVGLDAYLGSNRKWSTTITFCWI